MRNFIILLKFAIEIITKKQTLIEDRFIFTSTLRSPNHGFQPPFQSLFLLLDKQQNFNPLFDNMDFQNRGLKIGFPDENKMVVT